MKKLDYIVRGFILWLSLVVIFLFGAVARLFIGGEVNVPCYALQCVVYGLVFAVIIMAILWWIKKREEE